jgi:PhoPQ-activated pathogenicity-related protein
LSACTIVFLGKAAIAAELGATFNPVNGQVEVTLTGGTSRWHSVEASTNLLTWGAVTNFYQASPSSSAWTEAGVSNYPQHFFRSRDLTTALDTYVATPDTNYSYTLLSSNSSLGQTTYVFDLRSQAWLTTNEVDRTLWKHWLVIVKPDSATNNQSFLWIDGGSNPGTPPTSGDSTLLFLAQVALDTKTVVSWLKMVPNEPLTFAGETSPRSEDGIIVYTWDKYMKTGDERWPARLPMTKAAVRAMDTVTVFCGALSSGALTVDKFVVGGGSKRGWTTWTTAAVDRRVIAIIPASIDVLNVGACLVHQYCAYGAWSYAIADYTTMDIMTNYGTPQFDALMNIEDPYSYRGRLTMPKFELYGGGDQYFLPDSSQFYFNDLPGVKYMRCIPNVDHSLNDGNPLPDAFYSLWAYYQSIILKTSLPQFTWTLQSSNTVRVVATNPPPDVVKLWQASNPNARDFRLSTIGAAWTSTTLTDQGGGVYLGAVSSPSQGWKAFFVELDYNRAGLQPLKFTTQVYVVPDTLPYTWPPAP